MDGLYLSIDDAILPLLNVRVAVDGPVTGPPADHGPWLLGQHLWLNGEQVGLLTEAL